MNYNHSVVLYHSNTRGQLQGTKIPILRKRALGLLPVFKYEDKERYYIISEDVITDSDEWTVERTINYSPLLRFGDIFQLKNKKTGLYLSSYENEKSEQTKQGLMCLSSHPQLFYFQSPTIDQQIADILHRQIVKIVNIENGLALHSHKDRYKNPKVKHMEVTAFKDKDSNDFWILEYRTHPIQVQKNIISSFQKIIIRNQVEIKYLSEKAGELHPGTIKNSLVFELLSDKNNTLQLMNSKSKQYLDYVFKDGQDLTTFQIDLPLMGWTIIPLTEQTLVYGQPVHIIKNGRHLTLYKDRIALLLHPTIQSQWMIELP